MLLSVIVPLYNRGGFVRRMKDCLGRQDAQEKLQNFRAGKSQGFQGSEKYGRPMESGRSEEFGRSEKHGRSDKSGSLCEDENQQCGLPDFEPRSYGKPDGLNVKDAPESCSHVVSCAGETLKSVIEAEQISRAEVAEVATADGKEHIKKGAADNGVAGWNENKNKNVKARQAETEHAGRDESRKTRTAESLPGWVNESANACKDLYQSYITNETDRGGYTWTDDVCRAGADLQSEKAIKCGRVEAIGTDNPGTGTEEFGVEFLLINDCSSDDTLVRLAECGVEHDPRFRVIALEKNGGYGHVCNVGLREARGKYVSVYEPDDVIAHDFYSTLLIEALKHPEADIVRYNGFYHVCGEKAEKKYFCHRRYTGRILARDMCSRLWKTHPSVFNCIYRRKFLEDQGITFCETPQASFQDATFLVSLYYSNPKTLIVDDAKYYYTDHPMQSVKNGQSKLRFVFQNWIQERKWMEERAISDYSYYNYRMITQYRTLLKKYSDIERAWVMKSVRRLLGNRCMKRFPNLATVRERMSNYMFSLKVRGFRRTRNGNNTK